MKIGGIIFLNILLMVSYLIGQGSITFILIPCLLGELEQLIINKGGKYDLIDEI